MFTKAELLFIYDALAICRFASVEYNGQVVKKIDLMEKVAEAENLFTWKGK